MSKNFDRMTRDELIGELIRLTCPDLSNYGTVVQELETYKEETRVQTEQLIESQRMLERSRDRYAMLYDFAPIAYLTMDEEGVIRDVNRPGARLLGHERPRVVDRPFMRFVAETDRRAWLDHLRGWWQEPEAPARFEITLRSGAIVQVVPRAMEEDDQKVYHVALVDLTRQKQADEEIRELHQGLEPQVHARTAELQTALAELRIADRNKNQFLAMLGHELRNPLASISAGLALLHMAELPTAERVQTLQVMERQLQNMIALLNDVLDVSRMAHGKVQLQRRIQRVGEMVRAAAQTCQELIAGRRHTLEIEQCQEPCLVHCDRARFEQMVVNLLQNAAKYTDPGGTIRVVIQQQQRDVRVDVSDTGCGMSEEVRHRAFDLFSQADSTLDRSQGGLGVGLTIVKALAEMHGGRVEAFSAGPGQGSRFTLWLPAYNPGEREVVDAEARPPAPAKEIGPLRIMIVDDNTDSAHLLKLLLDHCGHQVQVFHDGLAGLAAIAVGHPNVAIVDIGLPGMDGFQIARRLREQIAREDLLLIALSGFGSQDDRQRSVEAGFDAHLTKPISAENLLDTLRLAPKP